MLGIEDSAESSYAFGMSSNFMSCRCHSNALRQRSGSPPKAECMHRKSFHVVNQKANLVVPVADLAARALRPSWHHRSQLPGEFVAELERCRCQESTKQM